MATPITNDTADDVALPDPRMIRIAAFSCDGLEELSLALGFPVAVVAAVDDARRHARRLRDLWRGSVAVGIDGCPPRDVVDRSYLDWRPVRLDPRWLEASRAPSGSRIEDGALLLPLPADVDREAFAAAFREGLADARCGDAARLPPSPAGSDHARGAPPPTRAGAPTALDGVPFAPGDLADVAGIALATLARLTDSSRALATPRQRP